MKTTIILITALLASFTALHAQQVENAPDTVANVPSPKEIIVTDNGHTTSVEVNGTATRPAYHFQYSVSADTTSSEAPAISLPFIGTRLSAPSSREVTFFSDIFCGVVIPYHGPEAVRTSWEAGVGNLIGYRYKFGKSGASVGFGLGFGAKQLEVRRHMLPGIENDCLLLYPAPEGASNVRTHITSWNFQIPVYYRQRLYRSLSFKLSTILNYNFTTRASSSYTIGNVDYGQKVSGLHQRLITPDFVFSIGSLDFGSIYVRWSPVKMFKTTYGPDISTIAIGFSLDM